MSEERFLSESQWDCMEKFNGREILRWCDVPEKKMFKVLLLEKQHNDKSFESYVIYLADANEKQYKAYAPKHFIADLRRNRTVKTRPYFASHGIRGVGNRQIAQFELCYQKVDKSFEIFCDGAKQEI